MIEAGRPRAGTRLIRKHDRFAYRARVGVSRVFRKIMPADDAFLGVEVDQDERPAIEKTDLRDDGTFERNGEGSELDISQHQAGNSYR